MDEMGRAKIKRTVTRVGILEEGVSFEDKKWIIEHGGHRIWLDSHSVVVNIIINNKNEME